MALQQPTRGGGSANTAPAPARAAAARPAGAPARSASVNPINAVAKRPAWKAKLGGLWQMPLLVISVALFGVAAWLFIDPKAGPSVDVKLDGARQLLKQERAEAANEYLNRLLQREKLDQAREAEVHSMLAESLAMWQEQKKISVPENHRRIVEQILTAQELGAKPTPESNQRMAKSMEALGRPTEALTYYRRAMMQSPDKAMRLQRKIIDLQLAADDSAGAQASLEEYLGRKEVYGSERSWALGEVAHLNIDKGEFEIARTSLDEALTLSVDSVDQGQIKYWLGYCEFKLGNKPEAERYLRVARDQLKVQHPLDGEAAYLLGRLAQDAGKGEEANSFYGVVLESHPDAKVAPLARLGRGVCRIMAADDENGLADLHDVTAYVSDRESAKKRYKVDVLLGLKQAATILASRENYQGALEAMTYEQSLSAPVGAAGANPATSGPPASFYARLTDVYEKRADQVERNIPDSIKPAEKIKREQQVRDLRAKAGDASIAYSRALTVSDDKGYADALWRGVELYDRAGDLSRMIAALEVFAAERPEDAMAPEALLRLGRAYQAAGNFDKAIAAYQRNQFRYPNALAASKSAVPLAQALVAKGPQFYGKAETVLLGVVENNPLVTPEAQEFRQSLFELAQLYYRTQRFEEALARYEEITQRYPKDERTAQLIFLMGDSYRKSAAALNVDLKAPGSPVAAATTNAVLAAAKTGPGAKGATTKPLADADPVEVAAAKRSRLTEARRLFDKAIEVYRRTPPSGEIDKLYMKLAHFYRADCVFDLGGYEESIRLYDAAAFRYQDDPSALAAYVQIVNAYCALGKFNEAKTANERAKWLLKKMPAEAFNDGGFTMPKEYWDKWLQWTGNAGIW